MSSIEGIWRLVESRAWDANGERMSAPYGEHPFGEIMFSNGRMLAALCNGDTEIAPGSSRSYSSYGGFYTFDGETLETTVDVASDPTRIGSRQVRGVEMIGERQMMLRPPSRLYGDKQERRELIWEHVWSPS